MSIQIFQDLKLHGGLHFTQANTDFPLNPEIGTVVLKGTALYAYITLGGMETWYPFANRTRSYIHTQGAPNTVWTITHNLGSADVWTQIKDQTGAIVYATTSIVDENTIQINFTSAITGTAVVVAPDSIDVPEVKAALIKVGDAIEINSTGVIINGSYALTTAVIDEQINSAIELEASIRSAMDSTLQASLDTHLHDNEYIRKDDNALPLADSTISSNVLTTTSTDSQVCDSFSASSYRYAKYAVQVSSGTSYQASEIGVIHNGTSVSTVEYGVITTDGIIASFDADISAGNVRLLVVPVNANSKVVVIRTLLSS